ncbi:unnamed protein product [Nippostrongylus brasiliensis]|uniref:Sulfotransfer_1 domain-containing protein n=1 Tax=Nippostrongylus brasiliensis TaxID=27835 RepID=A0A0N4YRE4_NIPBR|nr:unnamed protein product [Nippostrongylus brasiliensis]
MSSSSERLRHQYAVMTVILIVIFLISYYFLHRDNSGPPRQVHFKKDVDPEGLSKHLNEVARDIGMGNLTGVPSYHALENQTYHVAAKYHLATCEIPKNLVMLTRSVICYLADDTERALDGDNSTNGNGSCTLPPAKQRLQEVADIGGPNKTTTFVVFRDPFDRFVSGYLEFCNRAKKCFGCGTNLRCFLGELQKKLVEFEGNSTANSPFPWLLNLFAPQVWFCDFDVNQAHYSLVRYSAGTKADAQKVIDEIDQILAKVDVPSQMRAQIRSEFSGKGTRDLVVKPPYRLRIERRLMQDDDALALLSQIYFYDFLKFGYGKKVTEKAQ